MTLTNKETVGSPPFVVTLFAKNSPYTEAFNKQYIQNTVIQCCQNLFTFFLFQSISRLQRQIEAGLIDYNVRKYMVRFGFFYYLTT